MTVIGSFSSLKSRWSAERRILVTLILGIVNEQTVVIDSVGIAIEMAEMENGAIDLSTAGARQDSSVFFISVWFHAFRRGPYVNW